MYLGKLNINSLGMVKLFFSFIIFATLSSCYNVNKKDVVVPEKLLSKTQMIELLTDIQITEAGFSINKNRKSANNLKPKYYSKILEQHNITIQQFKENIDYYHDSPKAFEEIYESVLGKLSKIQSEVIIEKEEFDKKKVADSIAHLNDSIVNISADTLNLNY